MEKDLYPHVKIYLEKLGFSVKGEICGCDVVGWRDGERAHVVIAEMKQNFTLELVLQGVDRCDSSDELWLAVRASRVGRGREKDSRVKKLCKMLGFGLLAISESGFVEPIVAPDVYAPRKNLKKRARLLREHQNRLGDPTTGGVSRHKIMTAYRQRALKIAQILLEKPQRPRDLKILAQDAPQILSRNVYGWFKRVERGVYGLTSSGQIAVKLFAARQE